MALHIVHSVKKESLKDEDLQSLVRLCGKSMLYLPSEYAPCSLVLLLAFVRLPSTWYSTVGISSAGSRIANFH